MKHEITVNRCRVRDNILWRVRWHEAGRVRRKFFTARDAADAHAVLLRGESRGARHELMTLTPDEQTDLIAAWREAKRRGLNLLALATAAQEKAKAPALDEVLVELQATKQKAGRAANYLYKLGRHITRFIKGRERMPVNLVTFRDVENFLDSQKLRSRPTLRSGISTFFKFAIRRGYRLDNPCARLETIHLEPLPPAVLTTEEATKCLIWLRANPRALAWFVLTTFAGLRPEEAEKTTWAQINFKEGWIRVEAQTSKMRQRRVVYPLPMVFIWLRLAKKLESELPLPMWARIWAQRVMSRKVLGWPVWKKDVTRHTAASMWLATEGSAAKVTTALGHSESVLRKNYLALVTQEQARAFWALLPETVK